jgi:hypothetical protein
MRQVVAVVLGLGIIALTAPGAVRGAEQCPAELAQAKAALKSAQAQAKTQDIQSPRSQAGARSQELQAPRSQQDIQAPRQQELQAPRAQQDIQAPRQQELQAPRSQQDIQAPRMKQAAALVQQSDAACKKGDMALSAKKAREALGLLKK